MAFDQAAADTAVEQQLTDLFKEAKSEPAAPAAVVEDEPKLKPDDKAPTDASPKEPETPNEKILAALDAIEEEKPAEVKPDEAKPNLTDDQKTILDAIPNTQALDNLGKQLQGYNNFTSLLENGKFDGVEAELKHWNPDVLDGWLEYIYQKKVMSGEWVDRFMEDATGKGKSKDLIKLEKEFAALKGSLEEKKTNETQTAQQRQLQQALVDYTAHVEHLYDSLDFEKKDRKWVTAALNIEIAKDPELLAKIRGGNAKAVNSLFKKVSREYLTRDKEIATTKEEKIQDQEKKKPLLGGGNAVENTVPDDYSKVKKGDKAGLEAVEDNLLTSLFKKFKK